MHPAQPTSNLPSLLRDPGGPTGRQVRREELRADFVVVGGGAAGCCAAIAAARAGSSVVLVQDRPVLGGNASSEVRLWLLGATCHMGSNNRFAREGGIIGEIFLENLWRNKEGNPLIFDTILLEWAVREPRLRLLLNTAVHSCSTDAGDGRITGVDAFCAQNSTAYRIEAPLFCDSSGDGILGFCAGAAFRMGAESQAEFGEANAPGGEFGRLLGHSLYFYSKDAGRPVAFVPPAFALSDIAAIPRWRQFDSSTQGCRLWWIEWGGRFDTVHDTEAIKWELWKVVYGVWNHIKNSGRFPEAANLVLEWVGHIPGKRESRRFEGPCLLTQQDVVERRAHADVVAHGGWSIDLHPADGVYSDLNGSYHLQSKSVYGIPYRCYYSRTVPNLFLAGRIISTTHVAFGTTRVMATCAVGGQAVGTAAALCRERGVAPAGISADPSLVRELQRRLLRAGQYLPGVALREDDDLAPQAAIRASSTLALRELPADGPWLPLKTAQAQMLPWDGGRFPAVSLQVRSPGPCAIRLDLRVSERRDEHAPEIVLASRTVALPGGEQTFDPVDFAADIDGPRFVWIMVDGPAEVEVRTSEQRLTGLLALHLSQWHRDGKGGYKLTQRHLGGEDFALWVPQRRPEGRNLALRLARPIRAFAVENLVNGVARPMAGSNAWVADPGDPAPAVTFAWATAQTIQRIEIACDVDYDHAMETVQMGHPENAVPFCARTLVVRDGAGTELARIADNHQAEISIDLPAPATTDRLIIAVERMHGRVPAALLAVRVYARAARPPDRSTCVPSTAQPSGCSRGSAEGALRGRAAPGQTRTWDGEADSSGAAGTPRSGEVLWKDSPTG